MLGEGILQVVDLLQQVIIHVTALQGGLGHHQLTETLVWVGLEGIYLLQVLAMLLLKEIWKRSSLGLGV